MVEPSSILDVSYRGEAATLGAARRDVLAWLNEIGADAATLERAALIVSELATNALQAAPGSIYHVHVSRVDSEHAEISVRNTTSGTVPPTPDKWRKVDRGALRGRGLAIVNSLSEEVVVESGDGRVAVTARIRLR